MIHSSQPTNAASVSERLLESYQRPADSVLRAGARRLPSALEMRDVVEDLRELLFPGLTDAGAFPSVDVSSRVAARVDHLAVRLRRQIVGGGV